LKGREFDISLGLFFISTQSGNLLPWHLAEAQMVSVQMVAAPDILTTPIALRSCNAGKTDICFPLRNRIDIQQYRMDHFADRLRASPRRDISSIQLS
jgi:hypothetical protein